MHCYALCSVVCAHHIGEDLVPVVGVGGRGGGMAGAMTDMELALSGMLAGMQGASMTPHKGPRAPLCVRH